MIIPEHHLGCKRPCSDTNYYETFNRHNVRLVSAKTEPITNFYSDGLETKNEKHPLEIVVFATGFDAMTGSLEKINIVGKSGLSLKEKWGDGPKNYLGLGSSGFPNLFIITGPGSPSVLANMVVGIEQHVEWITDCINYMESHNLNTIDIEKEAEDEWVSHVNEVAKRTLYTSCNNWYLGANIPGKPRIFMPYIGGFPKYEKKCKSVVENDYQGFKFT